MKLSLTHKDIQSTEQAFEKSQSPREKFDFLTKIIEYHSFTNTKLAKTYLEEHRLLAEKLADDDCLMQHYLTAGFVENQYYNFILSDTYYQKALPFVEKNEDVDFKIEVFLDYVAICANANKNEEATNYLRKADRLLEAFPNDLLSARLGVRYAFIFMNNQMYENAIWSLLSAEDLFTRNEDDFTVKDYYFFSMALSALGHTYGIVGEREKSIACCAHAVNICETTGIRTRMSFHYMNLGRAYLDHGDVENAEVFFKKTINTADDISQSSRADAFANLGKCFFNRGELDEAKKLYKKARALHHSMSKDDYYNFSVIETFLGELFALQGKFNKARKHFMEGYEYALSSKNKQQIGKVCEEISKLFTQRNNFREAYKYLQQHLQMKNEQADEMLEIKASQLQNKYEYEKKEQESAFLRLKAIQLQHKALRAQMNPHFMFNVLNAIQKFITGGDVKAANLYLTKFADLMRDSLNYSDAEVISLEKELEFLENYLRLNQQMRFNGKMKFHIEVDDEIEPDIFGVPSMIIQPYVENALEHGIKSIKNGEILVSFELYDDNNLLCIVQDNGIGREKAALIQKDTAKNEINKKHRSMGTQITHERLMILHGSENENLEFVKIIDLKDKNGNGKGTKVEVIIPITDVQR
jgi:two-component system, LytTR family, sensor kinase